MSDYVITCCSTADLTDEIQKERNIPYACFTFEADGKTIVHTGDFRTHGRLGKGFFERLEKALTGKTVDVLITEGTMLSRLNETVLTEEQMQKKE